MRIKKTILLKFLMIGCFALLSEILEARLPPVFGADRLKATQSIETGTRFLSPVKILWKKENTDVRKAERLLLSGNGQADLVNNNMCVLKSTKLNHPGLLLDFALQTTVIGMAQADPQTYLEELRTELKKKWPANRTINLVFHGHSVPSGYFQTPAVHTLEAYPHQVLQQLKELYPNAVINVITTSIGGENAVQGEKRFEKEVLSHRPDVLFIDYALNDRAIGLKASRIAMEKMIRKALKKHIKIILMTPSPDLAVDMLKPDNILSQFGQQLIQLAAKYKIGVADSYAAFYDEARSGKQLSDYMAQSNHPNKKGHRLIADLIIKWF